jgi:flagellar protein FliS
MDAYQTRAIEGASGVELTVALYDGIIRFMNRAIIAVERGDVGQRRAAVKRAMDIVIHLQATLDVENGGGPAKALTEFYVAMFALMLQGSQANSRGKFEQVIACVRNVRGAWRQVANNSEVNPIPEPLSGLPPRHMQPEFENANSNMSFAAGSRWSA